MKIVKRHNQYIMIVNHDDLLNIECNVEYSIIDHITGKLEYLDVPEEGCEVKFKHPTIGARFVVMKCIYRNREFNDSLYE